MNGNPWTPEQDATLRAMRCDGATYEAIAVELGRDKNSCIGRAQRTGLIVSRDERRRQDDARMCDVLADGGSVADAAARLGCTLAYAQARFARIRAEMGWQAQ